MGESDGKIGENMLIGLQSIKAKRYVVKFKKYKRFGDFFCEVLKKLKLVSDGFVGFPNLFSFLKKQN